MYGSPGRTIKNFFFKIKKKTPQKTCHSFLFCFTEHVILLNYLIIFMPQLVLCFCKDVLKKNI